jgi:hypothetical protein
LRLLARFGEGGTTRFRKVFAVHFPLPQCRPVTKLPAGRDLTASGRRSSQGTGI